VQLRRLIARSNGRRPIDAGGRHRFWPPAIRFAADALWVIAHHGDWALDADFFRQWLARDLNDVQPRSTCWQLLAFASDGGGAGSCAAALSDSTVPLRHPAAVAGGNAAAPLAKLPDAWRAPQQALCEADDRVVRQAVATVRRCRSTLAAGGSVDARANYPSG
jgi:hypothetical protein